MFSIKIPYNVESSDDKQVISRMIREYNSMFRYAFNRIWNKESVEYKDVANLNNVGYMDSWYAISALKESKEFSIMRHVHQSINSRDWRIPAGLIFHRGRLHFPIAFS